MSARVSHANAEISNPLVQKLHPVTSLRAAAIATIGQNLLAREHVRHDDRGRDDRVPSQRYTGGWVVTLSRKALNAARVHNLQILHHLLHLS
jgi:hypothetical protein